MEDKEKGSEGVRRSEERRDEDGERGREKPKPIQRQNQERGREKGVKDDTQGTG